jgi:phage tail sheath protein FI
MVSSYLHGIETIEIDDDIRPIQTGPSNIIGLVGTAPDADTTMFPINEPILIAGNPRQAALLGSNGTIPDALNAIFEQFGADVVVVRIQDSDDINVQLSNVIGIQSSLTGLFALKKAKQILNLVPKLIIAPGFTEYRPPDGVASTIVNSGGTGYTQANTSVVLAGGSGYGAMGVPVVQNGSVVAITMKQRGWGYKPSRPASGTISFVSNPTNNSTITLNGTVVSFVTGTPTGNQVQVGTNLGATLTALTTFLDGSLDAQIGKCGYTASSTVLTITSKSVNASDNTFTIGTTITGASPSGAHLTGGIDPVMATIMGDGSGAMLTPVLGEVANPVVAYALGILDDMRAIFIADTPGTSYTEAVAYRGDFDSKRLWLVEGHVQIWDVFANQAVTGPVAAFLAGKQAFMDNNFGFWWSASNQALNGVIGVGRPIDWSFTSGTVEGQLLNSQGIAIVTRDQGFRVMGTQSPTSDALWQFLPVRRTADMIEDATEQAVRIAIDRPISLGTFDFIEGSVNAFLRNMANQGAIINGKAWLDKTINTPDQLQAGHLYIDYDIEPPAPLSRLTFRLHRNGS